MAGTGRSGPSRSDCRQRAPSSQQRRASPRPARARARSRSTASSPARSRPSTRRRPTSSSGSRCRRFGTRKVVMFGGGGFDGSIPNVAGNVPAGPTDQLVPLGRGYATLRQRLRPPGRRARLAGQQLRSQRGGAAQLRRRCDQEDPRRCRLPDQGALRGRFDRRRSYFAGGSTGGREAIAAITRWPADWDGAISWYPAWNDAVAILQGHRVNRALAQPGAYPSVPKSSCLLQNAALEACDGLEGVVDGLHQQPVALQCDLRPDDGIGERQPHCAARTASIPATRVSSDAQITALKTLNTDLQLHFALASGEDSLSGLQRLGR